MNYKKVGGNVLKVVLFGFTITAGYTAYKMYKNHLPENEITTLYENWIKEKNLIEKKKMYNQALKAGYEFTESKIIKLNVLKRIKTELIGKN